MLRGEKRRRYLACEKWANAAALSVITVEILLRVYCRETHAGYWKHYNDNVGHYVRPGLGQYHAIDVDALIICAT